MTFNSQSALGLLPSGLRNELTDEFSKIVRNYREGRWEAAELDGGRFCEIVYSVLRGYIDGGFPAAATKPANFPRACELLGQANKAEFPQSARLGIPRVLVALYEIRNNRGVGHVGGDVVANHMDATFVLHAAQWVMAELVRIFHSMSVSEAAAVVDALVERTLPVIWRVGDVLRVLDPGISLTDGTLLLLYSEALAGMDERTLARSLEQDRLANYRRVLKRLHAERKVEYDAEKGWAILSPRGVNDVEDRLLRVDQA